MVCPKPDNPFEFDYNDDGLDHSVRGAEKHPETGELKSLLDIPRYIWRGNQSKKFINEIYSKGPKKFYNTTKTEAYLIDGIWSLIILDWKD